MHTQDVQPAFFDVCGHAASKMTLRSTFGRQELKSAYDIERGVDL
jgi:hypothetical protein